MLTTSRRFISGIVPIDHQPFDFKMPWHDCFMPIAPNWTAVEKAVLECACAGARMIWIVCPRKIEPLLFARLGRSVLDPMYASSKKVMAKKREIPIYYCGLKGKDEDKKNSMPWSIITGAETIHKVSRQFSNVSGIDNFYVAFPYGLYNGLWLVRNRNILKQDKPVRFVYNNKSICDGEYLGFSTNIKQIKIAKKAFLSQATGIKKMINQKTLEYVRLPIEEQYSGRWLSLKDVFSGIFEGCETHDVDLVWYYNISSWKGYCEYLGSEKVRFIRRPSRKYFRKRENWSYRDLDEDFIE